METMAKARPTGQVVTAECGTPSSWRHASDHDKASIEERGFKQPILKNKSVMSTFKGEAKMRIEATSGTRDRFIMVAMRYLAVSDETVSHLQ